MKYSELFTLNSGLFKVLFKPEHSNLYKELFEDLSPEVLDSHAFFHYGDRTIIRKVNNGNYEDFVKNIILFYSNIWITQKGLLNLTYDITKPINEVTSITGNVKQNNSNNTLDIESSIAFNDTNFKENGKTENKTTTERKEENNLQNIRSGSIGTSNITADIQKEIAFRKQGFYNDVIKDIINNLTNKLY